MRSPPCVEHFHGSTLTWSKSIWYPLLFSYFYCDSNFSYGKQCVRQGTLPTRISLIFLYAAKGHLISLSWGRELKRQMDNTKAYKNGYKNPCFTPQQRLGWNDREDSGCERAQGHWWDLRSRPPSRAWLPTLLNEGVGEGGIQEPFQLWPNFLYWRISTTIQTTPEEVGRKSHSLQAQKGLQIFL